MTLQWKLIAIVAVVLFWGATAAGSYLRGRSDGNYAALKVAQKKELEQREELRKVEEELRETERLYEKKISQIQSAFASSQKEAELVNRRVVSDLRLGNRRLQLQVSSCNTTQTDKVDPAPERTDGPRTAELTPEVAEALWRIADDGDRAIRKLTWLQEWALKAVELCNGKESY